MVFLSHCVIIGSVANPWKGLRIVNSGYSILTDEALAKAKNRLCIRSIGNKIFPRSGKRAFILLVQFIVNMVSVLQDSCDQLASSRRLSNIASSLPVPLTLTIIDYYQTSMLVLFMRRSEL